MREYVRFTVVRLLSDLIINHITTAYFLRGKVVNPKRYNAWQESQKGKVDVFEDEVIEVEECEIKIQDSEDKEILMKPLSKQNLERD